MTIQSSPAADDNSLDDAQHDNQDHDEVDHAEDHAKEAPSSGGQVSEAGGASLNAETTLGGADAVPDTHG